MSPLPDADPDKRIYALLKNTDLENLSFSDFQGVAEKVYAEQGAEDTLRRIVLVNLARLAVAGEWNGLTSAGGGGWVQSPAPLTATNYDTYDVSVAAPFGITLRDTDSADDEPCFQPFYSPKTGTVAAVTCGISSAAASACNLLIGLYNSDTNGKPSTLIASATLDATSTGDVRQTTFSGTPSLTKDTLYYVAYCRSTNISFQYRSSKSLYQPGPGPTNSTEDSKSHLELQSSDNTLPSTVTEGNLQTVNSETPSILLEW